MNLFKFKHGNEPMDDEDYIEGERVPGSVNKGITIQNKITNWAVIVGACALAGCLLYKYYAGMYRQYRETKAPAKDVTRTVATTTLPPLTMPEPVAEPSRPTQAKDEALPPLQPPFRAPESPVVSTPGAPQAAQVARSTSDLVRERRLKREVRFNLENGVPSVGVEHTAGQPSDAGSVAPTSAPVGSQTQQASFSLARAYMLPDPTLMMTRGRVIPCTVLPAIDTTLPGVVTCITSEDATGADNKVSLMDRGTLCTGKQGGGVSHGQRRVGIIWERCETPQHVLVPLEAGSTDSLGRPGIPGQVDNHFWDRFGGAIALSLITDIGPYLVATRQGGTNNTTIAFPNMTGPQEVMSEVLKNTVDIRPTIYAPQAARVLIYLAGDIDFRDVYQLERRK